MNKKTVLVLSVLYMLSSFSFCSLITSGSRPLSLANVYVANNGEVYSLFNNPAGLYGKKIVDVKFDLLTNLNFTGNILYNISNIIESAEKFSSIRESQQEGNEIDIVEIFSLLNAIKNLVEIDKPGKGILIGTNGGVAIKVKEFAVSLRNITNVGLKPHLDTNFYLGAISTSSFNNQVINKFDVVRFYKKSSTINQEGVILTTDTLKYENLLSVRDELAYDILPWLITELEKMSIEIPQEIRDNLEGIANALINSAIDKGVSEQDVKDAVKQLKDPYFQNLISSTIKTASNYTTLQHNESGLVIKGANYTELVLGYSYSILENLHIGASIKYLIGKTFYYNFKIFQENEMLDFKDISDLENKLVRDSQAVGLDIGAIYRLPLPVVETNIGLVIKNLIEPQFSLPKTNEKLKLPRQVKLGAMGSFKILRFGLDLDLNKAETFVKGYNIQNIALCLEVNPPILPSLRLGYLRNLVYERDQLFSFGLGFKIFVVNFDLVCAFNPQKTKITKDFTLPATNLFLGSNLGVQF